jgi:hypothetical protein
MGEFFSDAFWTSFMAETWERDPRGATVPQQPVVSSEMAFAAACRAGEELRRGRSDVLARWAAGTDSPRAVRAQDRVASAPMPRAQDASFAGYVQRLQRDHGIASFFLVISHLHWFSQAFAANAQRFAREICRRVGVPASSAWSDVYMGNYATSPFGVHLDGASNFTFGIHGRKTLYLWEPKFYRAHQQAFASGHWRDFICDSIILDVRAGEMIYWPARFWHVADSHGELSVTVNIAFYENARRLDLALPTLHSCIQSADSEWLNEPLGNYPYDDSSNPDVSAFRFEMDRTLGLLQRLGRDRELRQKLEHELIARWLRARSSLGFQQRAEPEGLSGMGPHSLLGAKDAEIRLNLNPALTILWTRGPRGELIFAANGKSNSIEQATANIVRLFARLNSGAAASVSQLCQEFSGSAEVDGYELETSPELIAAILSQLVAWGAARWSVATTQAA